MNTKRKRGRPPKQDQWGAAAADINAALERLGIEPNIIDPVVDQIRAYREEYRRERVSEEVRAAYREGRNNANKTRKRDALKELDRVADENKLLILNFSLSTSAVIQRIKDQQKNRKVGRRALRMRIVAMRKFVGPNS